MGLDYELVETSKVLIMVQRSRNARGLGGAPHVLAEPPCVHRKGLMCSSQKL